MSATKPGSKKAGGEEVVVSTKLRDVYHVAATTRGDTGKEHPERSPCTETTVPTFLRIGNTTATAAATATTALSQFTPTSVRLIVEYSLYINEKVRLSDRNDRRLLRLWHLMEMIEARHTV